MAEVNVLSGVQTVQLGGGTFNAAQTITFNHNISVHSAFAVPVPLRLQSSIRFTGRQDILERLEAHFNSYINTPLQQRRYLIYGMAGIGKTQVCLKFIEEMSSRFSHIFWIDGSSHATIMQGLKRICNDSTVNLSLNELPESQAVDRACQWLSSLEKNYLLVFDNVDSLGPHELEKYIPLGLGGNILITSRNTQMQTITQNSMEITQMNEEDAISLLLKTSGLGEVDQETKDEARKIVTALGCLPLAVDQAGAYILGTGKILEYRKSYSRHRKDLLHSPLGQCASYERNFYESLEISFSSIKLLAESEGPHSKAAQSAIIILSIFAFYLFDSFTKEIFKHAAENSHQGAKENIVDAGIQMAIPVLDCPLLSLDEDGKWDSFFFDEGMCFLTSWSMIKQSQSGYSIHPLVHAWCQDRMTLQEQQKYFLQGYEILIVSVSKYLETQSVTFWECIVAHLKGIHESRTQFKVQIPYYGGQCARGHLASVYHHLKRYDEAHELHIQLLEERKKTHGQEHPYTIIAMSNLSKTYYCLRKYSEAELLSSQVLDAGLRVLGEGHSQIIHTREILAGMYHRLGKYVKAEQQNVQLLNVRKRIFGEEHPGTICTMEKLADTYYYQKRYEEAEPLYIQVFDEIKKMHGNENPNTISFMENLSHTYYQLGKYTEAEQLNVQVLEVRKKNLGDEHHLTLNTFADLANTYYKLERYSEAVKLQVQVLKVRKRIFGDEDFFTIIAMRDLASTYYSLGNYSKAKELQSPVLKASIMIHGSEHEKTILAMEKLAKTYHHLKKYDKLEKLQIKILDAKKKVLGGDHPKTILSMDNLVSTLYRLRRYAGASKLFTELLVTRQKTLGEEHPQTITTMTYLANTHHILGEYVEAEKLQTQILDINKRISGEEDSDTITSMRNLATTYCSLEKYAEAEILNEKVLEIRKRILGEEDPQTLTALGDLARTYHGLGKFLEAKKLQVQILNARKILLPKGHSDILTAMADLGSTYYSMGEYDQAEELQNYVFQEADKCFGNEALFTMRSVTDLAKTLKSQSKGVQALVLFQMALRLQQRVLGCAHPHTKQSKSMSEELSKQLKGQVSSGIKRGFWKVTSKISNWTNMSRNVDHDAGHNSDHENGIDHDSNDGADHDSNDDADHDSNDGADQALDDEADSANQNGDNSLGHDADQITNNNADYDNPSTIADHISGHIAECKVTDIDNALKF